MSIQNQTGKSLLEKFQNSTGTEISANVTYDFDIVVCLDITESMQPCIDMIKENILTLPKELNEGAKKENRTISSLRMKIIGFRDWVFDGICKDPQQTWFTASDFYTLIEKGKETNETQYVRDFLSTLHEMGGGDLPETSLEALALAMRSDWREVDELGDHPRHMVVLITDDIYKPLENIRNISQEDRDELISRGMPDDMPQTFSELIMCWNATDKMYSENRFSDSLGRYYMHPRYKRLLVFAPDKPEWDTITAMAEREITQNIEAENGGKDLDWSVLIDEILRSAK